MRPEDNFSHLLHSVPSLDQVIIQLNTAHIRYGIYAGAYVSMLTSNRPAKDVDFLVAGDDFPRVRSLFDDSPDKKIDVTNILYPQGNKTIELMTMAGYDFGDSH